MKPLNIFNKYWPVILASWTILSLAFSFFYQFHSLKYTVNSTSQQLENERSNMRSYVDLKDKTTNVRIDDLSDDVSKIHDDLTNINNRFDFLQNQISNQIQQSREEESEHFAQLILLMNTKKQ